MRYGIAVMVATAFSVTGGMSMGTAHALPTCTYEDGTVGTACVWSVEVDGVTSLVPACAEEDGNTDGLPCLWFSPRTGNAYYNDGSNYR